MRVFIERYIYTIRQELLRYVGDAVREKGSSTTAAGGTQGVATEQAQAYSGRLRRAEQIAVDQCSTDNDINSISSSSSRIDLDECVTPTAFTQKEKKAFEEVSILPPLAGVLYELPNVRFRNECFIPRGYAVREEH